MTKFEQKHQFLMEEDLLSELQAFWNKSELSQMMMPQSLSFKIMCYF